MDVVNDNEKKNTQTTIDQPDSIIDDIESDKYPGHLQIAIYSLTTTIQ